jgi:hypothetical protein
MALSEQVEESLRDAQSELRNALAFAARSEKAFISMHIGKMMHDIDNLIDVHDIVEKLENRKLGDNGKWGPFLHGELPEDNDWDE